MSQCLLQTLSPKIEERKPAEKYIESCESQEGFCQILLQLIGATDQDETVKLCAAIAFKNFIKKNWAHLDDSTKDKISQTDRDFIKNIILDLMLKSENQMQKQLSEAVSIIGQSDFPVKWSNLTESMVAKIKEACTQLNFVQINGILQTAEILFKRYDYEAKSQGLWEEIKFVLDTFAKPFTELFVWIIDLIPNHVDNPKNIKLIFHSLVHCAKIFYSLNYQDIPEFFEDNLDVWMSRFAKLLQFKIECLKSDNEDDPGVIEDLQSQICENIGVYADKYSEEFEKYLPGFIEQVWSLLDSLNSSTKYDLLVSNAIRFLSIVAHRGLHKDIFEKEQVLQQINSRVIIPNMEFREADEELFEDNAEEYIQRDIEGADVHTRRRAACDFVKALARHFEKQMTEVFSKYIESLLINYNQNAQQNWKSKDAAIYLVTSMAVKDGSVRLGTLSTSNFINVTDFFKNVILVDLQRNDGTLPVLTADALKYVIVFRNQLSREIIVAILPNIIQHLSSPNVVVHSYASNALLKLFTLKDPNNKTMTIVRPEDVVQYSGNLVEGLFGVLQFPGSSENEYAMKAIVCCLNLLKESMLPTFTFLLHKLTEKLTEVAKNPSKPFFNHYLFESLSLAIRICCGKDPSLVSHFEPLLFPIFQNILIQDVQEFMPYVFQIQSLLIEQYKPGQQVSPVYMEMFPFLLSPALWETPANIAPLVRLLQGCIKHGHDQIVSMGKIEPLLGVFQRLIASKMNDHHGFALINDMVLYIDTSHLMPLMRQVFFILFQRLTSTKTVKYVKSLLCFFSIFAYKYGSKSLFDLIESIQTNMFAMVVEKLFIQDAQKVSGRNHRKMVAVGITKILCELDNFLTSSFAHLWSPLLETLIAIFELPEMETPEEDVFVEIEEASGYQASYSQLSFGKKKEVDPMADIADAKIYLAQQLSRLSQKFPGKLNALINVISPQALQFLQKYCLLANVTIV